MWIYQHTLTVSMKIHHEHVTLESLEVQLYSLRTYILMGDSGNKEII